VQGSEQKSSGSSPIVRFAAVAAIVIGTVLAAFLLFGGSSGHKYKLIFETGGQLVPGNLVSVGGQQVGTVDDIKLTDDARAEVSITVDDPLHEGTTAVVRPPPCRASPTATSRWPRGRTAPPSSTTTR
jgi:ABC-type transporter Mla subunit MlaD